MFRTILTPLDGSPFAEHALPWAAAIARRSGATLDLIHGHASYAMAETGRGLVSLRPRG
jgi:nucleotide-binding universal stress UspA family protein